MASEYLASFDVSAFTPPSSSTPVYKEDCMFSFGTAYDPEGLDICLNCFQSFSRGGLNYTQQHSEFFEHKLFLNYKKTLKPVKERSTEQPLKMVKLEIREQSEDELFDIKSQIYCSEIDSSIDYPNGQLPDKIRLVADAVLNSTSSDRKEEIKSWEQQILPCAHAFEIIQTPLPEVDLTKCQTCGLTENLWICLSCGSLGCGRAQFGGVAGNSHALAHNESSGGHHIAVKLGSLSMDSADCYCYTCNDEVKVPDLVKCLQTYGIDISSFVKTEKNLTELQIEQNIKWDFNMDGKDGEILQPVFGEGLTGLKNLGNSCYLASVLQVLFSIPSFTDAFHIEEGMPVDKILNPGNPANDLETQLYKIGDGLLSGRYSIPDEFTTETVKYQRGIKPSTFKTLIGEGHPEFCTMQQQDAFEFWMYLTDIIEKKGLVGVSDSNPNDTFKYILESKIKCKTCGGVSITNELSDNLCLPVGDELVNVDEDGKKYYKEVTFNECISNWYSPEQIEYNCPACRSKQVAQKKQGFKSYPEHLVISPQRIKLENWVPVKIDVPIKMEEILNISNAKAEGKLPDEIEFPREEKSGVTESAFEFNVEAMNMLQGMGFPENRCKRALYNTGNSSGEIAMNWLFEHMEDADIDLPFEIPSSNSTNSRKQAKQEDIDSLVSMGFSDKLASKALIVNNGNIEQAVEWLFSNPDDDGEIPDDSNDNTRTSKESQADKIKRLESESVGSDGIYQLKAVICHKGTSIHSGHYVAFVKKIIDGTENWVLFNDEKVVIADEESLKDVETCGYIYVFVRQRSGSRLAYRGD